MAKKKCNSSSGGAPDPLRKSFRRSWTADSLLAAADEYFQWCDCRTKQVATKHGVELIADPRPYTVEGLCCRLKFSVNQFYRWMKRPDDFGDAVEFIHQRIMADRVEGALDGRQNAGMAQFMLKNNYPEFYRDKLEVANSVADADRAMLEAWSEMWKVQEERKRL